MNSKYLVAFIDQIHVEYNFSKSEMHPNECRPLQPIIVYKKPRILKAQTVNFQILFLFYFSLQP